MAEQNYSNYRKFYPPHHFIFLPVCFGLFVYGIIKILKLMLRKTSLGTFFNRNVSHTFLAVMLRQHYALGNQNRIIRLGFKQRYFELFGKMSNPVEKN